MWFGGLAAVGGCLLGCAVDQPGVWVALGCALAVLGIVVPVRGRRWVVLAGVGVFFAGWSAIGHGFTAADDLRGVLVPERRLVAVVGRVIEPFRALGQADSPLAGFAYRPPTRTTLLEVESVTVEGEERRVSGRLQVLVTGEGALPRVGRSLRIMGWLTPIGPPANPGGFDARGYHARHGVYGRLRAGTGAIRVLDDEGWRPRAWWSGVQGWLSASLLAGMKSEEARALVDAVILGRRDAALVPLYEDFRGSGLAHLLAISGTHIGIVVVLTLGVLRLGVRSPKARLLIGIAVLLLYIVVLPPRASVLRSGVMAASLMLAGWSGRVLTGLDALGLAALLVLVFDPQQVMDVGFELSFAAVAGILVYVRLVHRWRMRREVIRFEGVSVVERCRGWVVSVLGAGFSAWLATMPIAAGHFGWVVITGPVLTLIATPVLMLLIGIGLVKMVVGLMVPAVSAVLGGVMSGLAWALIGLAGWGASLPGTSWHVSTVSSWGIWREPGVWEVTYLSVGNGNAYVVRWPDGRCWLMDAGGYPGAGRRVIEPALRSWGIDRIDTLVISHGDLDHYAAVPELLESMAVDRILVPECFVGREEVLEDSGLGVLHRSVVEAGLSLTRVAGGWEQRIGEARVTALWPPEGAQGLSDNDGSLVLKVDVNGRIVLFTGDLDAEGIAGVEEVLGDQRVDLVDLPHHGSRKDFALDWVPRLEPEVAVQSSGWPRSVGVSPWVGVLPGVRLCETWRDGAVTVRVGLDGRISVLGHLVGEID